MSESIYEQYKAALRRGHLAVLRGQLEAAIEAYRAASAIVPERALPHASIGAVELRRGRPAEALAAFELALERAPNDEGALSGRAEALVALGERAAAAETLDRLAALLESDGRLAEACDVVARALELAESRSRRLQMAALTARLRASPLDAAAEAALARAVSVLEERGGPTVEALRGRPVGPDAAGPGSEAPVVGVEARSPRPGPGIASEPPLPAAATEAAGSEAGVEAASSEAGLEAAASDAGVEESAEAGEPVTASPEPPGIAEALRLSLAAEAALEAGDRTAAVEQFLEAAAAYAAAGRLTAALDACGRVVAAYPDALEAQEALVHLYLELGWRSLATEKVALLERLTASVDDPLLRARVLRLAGELGLVTAPTTDR